MLLSGMKNTRFCRIKVFNGNRELFLSAIRVLDKVDISLHIYHYVFNAQIEKKNPTIIWNQVWTSSHSYSVALLLNRRSKFQIITPTTKRTLLALEQSLVNKQKIIRFYLFSISEIAKKKWTSVTRNSSLKENLSNFNVLPCNSQKMKQQP